MTTEKVWSLAIEIMENLQLQESDLFSRLNLKDSVCSQVYSQTTRLIQKNAGYSQVKRRFFSHSFQL